MPPIHFGWLKSTFEPTELSTMRVIKFFILIKELAPKRWFNKVFRVYIYIWKTNKCINGSNDRNVRQTIWNLGSNLVFFAVHLFPISRMARLARSRLTLMFLYLTDFEALIREAGPIFPEILETCLCQNLGTQNEHFPYECYCWIWINVCVSYATKLLV